MAFNNTLIAVPDGHINIGTTLSEVEAQVVIWGEQLVNPSYTKQQFKQWLLKEFPPYKMRLENFRIQKYPVTNLEYRSFLSSTTGSIPESIRRNEPNKCPVWGVSLADVQKFAAWKSAEDGIAYRLPTEFEWEYAAGGPNKTRYPFGEQFDPSKCNTKEARIGHTTPVDQYDSSPSYFGVCDMAGNVEEWTSSTYTPYPGGFFIEDDLVDTCGNDYPILRGGSFALGGDLARSARRHGPHPGPNFQYRGFRLVTQILI